MALSALLTLLSSLAGKKAPQQNERQTTTPVQPAVTNNQAAQVQPVEGWDAQLQRNQNMINSGPMQRMAQGNSMQYPQPNYMTGKDLTGQ